MSNNKEQHIIRNMEVAYMPLTPLDIHNKEFARGFRGYDEDEVNDFLDQGDPNHHFSTVQAVLQLTYGTLSDKLLLLS